MPRASSGKPALRKRKRMRKLTKGYRGGRGNLVRQAVVTRLRAGAFALKHRRMKKRSFRRLWIVRLNAACRLRGLRYSEFIAGVQRANIGLDRKMLSELAINDPATFDQIVEMVKPQLPLAKSA